MKPVCVLAGNQRQFDEWLQRSGLQRRDAIYCNALDKVYGAEFSRIEKVGNWYVNPLANRILQEAKTRVR